MEEKAFSEAVALLSGEHSIRILKYLASGEWRIPAQVSRALDIHTTTASSFLRGMHVLSFLERRLRKNRNRAAFEYRLPTTRLSIGIEITERPAPLREATEFFVEYLSNVLEKARRLGWSGIAEKLEARLEKNRNRMKAHLFTRILDGGGARGADDLLALIRDIQRDFLAITSESMGRSAARLLLSGAADEARRGREDIVDRYAFRKVLEA
jgi:hypothetical protein